jgi:hypothetical protein
MRHGRDDDADRRVWAARERAAREGENGVADRWGRSVRGGAGARSWAAWAGAEWGTRGRGAGWARIGPAEGGGFFSFSVFYFFSFHFLFLFLFISFSFESIIF